MLFMLKAHLQKPTGISNKEFYDLWKQESEAALLRERVGARALRAALLYTFYSH